MNFRTSVVRTTLLLTVRSGLPRSNISSENGQSRETKLLMELILGVGLDSLSSERSSVMVSQEQHCNYIKGFRYMIWYINDHLGTEN